MIKYLIKNNFAGVVVVPVWEKSGLEAAVRDLDKKLGGLLSEMNQAADFEGEKLQMSFSRTADKTVPAVLLVGLGEKKKLDIRAWKQVAGAIIIALQNKKIERATLVLSKELVKKFGAKNIGAQTAVAVETAGYAYDEYKTKAEAKVKEWQELILVGAFSAADKNNLQTGLKAGAVIGASVNYTRHLGNTPPSIMTPSLLAREAEKLGKENSRIKVKVLSRPEMRKLKMGCLLGVSAGSAEEPKFIILEYWGEGKSKAPTVLAGKGITFDSGGLGIKPGNYMNDMKFDMLGAATVLGVMKAAVALKLKRNLVGLIPSCENMPGGQAYRPDDILTAHNGKTVEVVHTDAEGRLILADALSYASRYQPKVVIDFATLTGACVVALGNERSGLFGTDEKLLSKLKKSAGLAGEQLWPLPVGEEYSEAMKSEVADIKNLGGVSGLPGAGGASTAAAFLQFFTDYPWAHIDLSCSYYGGRGKNWIRPGANGFGVQTMIEYLK